MLEEIIQNRYAVTAVILFGIGFTNLMLQQNLLRKVIGFNIMDSAVFLLLASLGYIDGGVAPSRWGPGASTRCTSIPILAAGADRHCGICVHHGVFPGVDPADLPPLWHH